FNWATADNTATLADNDYVQVTSTPVTIPNGSSSATLPVTVNGDTTVEPNETFFVNVTGVTNATAGDVQGLGTITNDDIATTFIDTLTVSEYFELGRYGQTILYEGGRPRQFTEANPPRGAGNAAQADNISRRKVILDDDNNAQEWYLTTSTPPGPADGLQYVFYPRANGGFSVGTQGTDFFRGGDLVNGLTGVLHWSFPGFGADTWRIRPTSANPATFTVA